MVRAVPGSCCPPSVDEALPFPHVNRLTRCAASATVAPLLLGAVAPGLALAQDAADAPRPNIVVVMLDDANPHDGRLWSADLMPQLNDLVISPHDPDRIYAATRTGVHLSEDGGATWARPGALARIVAKISF